ncbi:MAG: MFS transporter [Anaerolineae bacterium]|nr:MFS transporter [Anaerolineae bacterium]
MKRMRWYDLLFVNLFWLGLNVRNNAVGTIFTPYLVDQFAPSAARNTALGVVRTAGLIIAMLVQPAAGLLSDRCTSRLGRRRPYILVGVLLDLVFMACFIVVPNYWSLLVVMLAIQFSANISHGALQGLIPDLVPEAQRGVASAMKAILELVPLVLLGLTIAPLVGAGRFNLAVLVTGAIVLLLMLLTLMLVKEEPIDRPPDVPLRPTMLRVLGMLAGIGVGAAAGLLGGGAVGGMVGLVAWAVAGGEIALRVGVAVGGIVAMAVAVVAGVWGGALATIGRDARAKPSFTWWMVNRLMFLAAITSIQHFAAFFIMYAFEVTRERAAAMTGTLMMVVGGFTLLSALPGGWLADRIGQRRLIALAGVLAVLGTVVLLGTIWVPRLPLVYVAGCILGLAAGLFMTNNWALGTRLVTSEEAGRYLGISNLAGAGAGIIGSGIGGPVADYLNGAVPGLGYFGIFCGYAVLFALSVVSLRGIRALGPSET